SWHDVFKEKYAIEFEKVIKDDIHPEKPGLTMGEVIEQINIASKHQAVVVTDVGQHQMIACRYAKFENSKSNITSGGLETMRLAIQDAICTKMVSPERQVVAVI